MSRGVLMVSFGGFKSRLEWTERAQRISICVAWGRRGIKKCKKAGAIIHM